MTGTERSFGAVEVFAEVTQQPAIFNALSPEAQKFLLERPPLSDGSGGWPAIDTLMEIYNHHLDALSPEAYKFVTYWHK